VFDRRFFLTWHAVRRQLAAMPNDFYFIRLIHGSACPNERLLGWRPVGAGIGIALFVSFRPFSSSFGTICTALP
jgi:hypothetical protein